MTLATRFNVNDTYGLQGLLTKPQIVIPYANTYELDMARASVWNFGKRHGLKLSANVEAKGQAAGNLIVLHRQPKPVIDLVPAAERLPAWTDEDIALFTQLWNEDATVAFMAQAFGKSKNTILGLRHKLKLPLRRQSNRGRK